MNFAYSVRVRVGILLIVFFSLLSSYQLLVQWLRFDLSFIGRDDVTLNEQRFDKIKEYLPSHGVVGYWPNGGPATYEQLIFGGAGDLQDWFLTQYALAPVIVSPTLGRTLIVSHRRLMPGVYSQESPSERFEAGREVLDFGNGLELIKRELE